MADKEPLSKANSNYSLGIIAFSFSLHALAFYLLMNLQSPEKSELSDNNGPTEVEITSAPLSSKSGSGVQEGEIEEKVAPPIQSPPVAKTDPSPQPHPTSPSPPVKEASVNSADPNLTEKEDLAGDPSFSHYPEAKEEEQEENDTTPATEESPEPGAQEPVKPDSTNNAPSEAPKNENPAETGAGQGTESTEDQGVPQGARLNSELQQRPGNIPPAYPALARQKGWEGTVALSYQVMPDGRVSDITISKSSGFEILDREAIRAVSQFLYMPGQEGKTYHRITFMLTKQQSSSISHSSSNGTPQLSSR